MEAGSIVPEVVDAAAAVTPTFTVLEAADGAGKTRLCLEAVARADGWLVAFATAIEREARLPLAVVSQLLPALTDHVDPDEDAGPALSRQLHAAAQRRPVLVVVDDCHWCDAASWHAVLVALRRAPAGRVAALLTARPGTVDDLPSQFVRRHLPSVGSPRKANGMLSRKELEVCLAVADGKTTREAAAALFISPKTIEFHLTHAYRKLGVVNRVQLARLAAHGRLTGGTGSSVPDEDCP